MYECKRAQIYLVMVDCLIRVFPCVSTIYLPLFVKILYTSWSNTSNDINFFSTYVTHYNTVWSHDCFTSAATCVTVLPLLSWYLLH